MNYSNLPNSALEISEQPKEIPNDTIISKVSNGSNFSNAVSFTQNLNDANKTTTRSNQ
ncbi:hypothetical protein KKKH17_06650 [Helicobacter pylori]